MIRILRQLWQNRKPVDPAPEPQLDLNNIYVQLGLAIARIGSSELHLSISSSSLGYVQSYSSNLAEMVKSLKEVNESLKEQKHIEQGLFYTRSIKNVRFDDLIFIQDGFYLDNPLEKIHQILEQVEIYYHLMKDADQAPYGYLEHNHRHLYRYTQSLTEFLVLLFQHFGQ